VLEGVLATDVCHVGQTGHRHAMLVHGASFPEQSKWALNGSHGKSNSSDSMITQIFSQGLIVSTVISGFSSNPCYRYIPLSNDL